jgi:beta-lactam-binding protein with PASTA domain
MQTPPDDQVGLVVGQDPQAGRSVAYGSTVTVEFEKRTTSSSEPNETSETNEPNEADETSEPNEPNVSSE